jgi:hypothetical protein
MLADSIIRCAASEAGGSPAVTRRILELRDHLGHGDLTPKESERIADRISELRVTLALQLWLEEKESLCGLKNAGGGA